MTWNAELTYNCLVAALAIATLTLTIISIWNLSVVWAIFGVYYLTIVSSELFCLLASI
jgi:hypothetical protein